MFFIFDLIQSIRHRKLLCLRPGDDRSGSIFALAAAFNKLWNAAVRDTAGKLLERRMREGY